MNSTKNSGLYYIKLLIGPLLALPFFTFIDLGNPDISNTAGIVLWTAAWWVTEVIPLGVTALLPIVLFPVFGIIPTKGITSFYAQDIVFLFIGGFMVAFAMEKWGLHRRIAYTLISWSGQSPSRIMLGFMMASFILSMWISNTATTVMLLPTAIAVIDKLQTLNENKNTNFFTGLLLAIAFSASIGGTSTLIGTPPNLIFLGDYVKFTGNQDINFLNWMAFALPISIVFFILTFLFFKWKFCKADLQLPPDFFKDQKKALGKPSFEQAVIFFVFTLMAIAWLTRKDIHLGSTTIPGWGSLFGDTDIVRDSGVAIFFSIVLFAIPSKNKKKGDRILGLEELKKLPMNIILLFGGGFALSAGIKQSGLGHLIAVQLHSLEGTSLIIITLCITILTLFLTEFTSNSAAIILLLPILYELGVEIGVDPLSLMLPATLASSFAFMLPISTPPNAVIMESGKVPLKEMMRTGIVMNLIGLVVVMIGTSTLVNLIF